MAAAETFRESDNPVMGMRICVSAAWIQASLRPSFSLPTTIADGAVKSMSQGAHTPDGVVTCMAMPRFVCFTENADGLAPGIEVQPLPGAGLAGFYGTALGFADFNGLRRPAGRILWNSAWICGF